MGQLLVFGVVGLVQVAIDSGALIGLTAMGVSLLTANVAGRFCGAIVGFLLNGTTTFSSQTNRRLHKGHAGRFTATWLILTALSTLVLYLLHLHASLGIIWLAKPLVEACMAVLSFMIAKFWIYK